MSCWFLALCFSVLLWGRCFINGQLICSTQFPPARCSPTPGAALLPCSHLTITLPTVLLHSQEINMFCAGRFCSTLGMHKIPPPGKLWQIIRISSGRELMCWNEFGDLFIYYLSVNHCADTSVPYLHSDVESLFSKCTLNKIQTENTRSSLKLQSTINFPCVNNHKT